VVRSFLAVREGEPCTELRRAETERILRAQPFIASARVFAFPDTGDGVRLRVETVDELSNVVGLAFNGVRPSVVKVGDGNVGGQGLYATALWREGFAYRDGYGARVVAYQIFDRPYQLAAEYLRRPVGKRQTAEFGHPFLTDLQRVAVARDGGVGRPAVQLRARPGGREQSDLDARVLGPRRRRAARRARAALALRRVALARDRVHAGGPVQYRATARAPTRRRCCRPATRARATRA
jgi:hypothetical protein